MRTGLLWLLILIPVFAQAASMKKEKKKELNRIVEELNQKRAEIEKYRKEERALEKDLLKIEDKREQSRDKLKRLKRDLAAAQGKIGDLRQKVDALQSAFGGWSDLLEEGLQAFSLRQRLDTPYYGSEELWGQVFLRASLLGQARYLENLQGMRTSTEKAAEEMRRRERQLVSRSEAEKQESRRQETLLKEKQVSLQTTQELRAGALSRVRELEEAAQALNQLLRSLEKRPRRTGPQALPVAQNSLPWPADGRVAGAFGKERIKGLDTWVIRSGIQIETAPGATVRAVRAGRVVYAGVFRKYGRIVILDHGGGFFSIYGFLDRIVKAKGDDVDARETIAYAGVSEDATAEAAPGRGMVYFEVRQNGTALDPANWLEKGK